MNSIKIQCFPSYCYFDGSIAQLASCIQFVIYNQIELDQVKIMDDSEDHSIQKQAEIYQRIRLLGSGAHGRAFLVKEISNDQEWVVKQINLSDLSPQQQQDSMKEAKILELLNHQSIIKFKQVYRTSKMKLNIVMQYAQCGDLASRIKQAKQQNTYLPEQLILNWFIQICLGIKHIHDRKIIHRDIKAQNVFLSHNNLAKIGDFGVAKVLENTISKARTVVGSPYYLSPQIIQNKPYSYKTDIWSLGTLLFELCALAPPFTANNIQYLALKIVQGSYPQIPKQYSEGMRNLIKWMLQTKQTNRPTINQILSSKTISARIDKFLSQSQQLEHKSANPVHKTQPFGLLRPPPNLYNMDTNQNKSQIISNQEETQSPTKIKAKTPQLNNKKGANNFFNRPPTAKRKVQNTSQLADLIQIKPSHFQHHEKQQKQPPLIPLPKVTKITSTNFIKNEPVKLRNQVKSPPSSAFAKKRASFTHFQGIAAVKKDLEYRPQNVQQKQIDIKKVGKIEKVEEKEAKKNTNKTQIRKKPVLKSKKNGEEIKLQICSQEIKKKSIVDKKVQKKTDRQKKQKPKRPSSQQRTQIIHIPIMQQQKCNSERDLNSNPSSYDYTRYEEDFDSYSQNSEQIELSFSETMSADGKESLQKLRDELKQIYKLANHQQANSNTLPLFGELIPEIINFSAQIRQDDSALQPNDSSVCTYRQTNSSQLTSRLNQQLALTVIQDNGQLQNLRMNLQQIFGEQNIIYAYHKIQSKINQKGLQFNEQQTIRQILKERPQIDSTTLKNYFRLIVTIVSIQRHII